MKTIIILFLLILMITGCEMTNEDKIDNIFVDYNHPDKPGAAVMIVKNGEITF